MYILVYYVPEEALEITKQALFDAGAGSIGNYSECCWQTKGEGQFRPKKGSFPYSGEIEKLFKASEYRVEMILEEGIKEKAEQRLLETHPYEVPAYHFLKKVL